MPRIHNEEPFGTSRHVWKWDANGEPTPEYEAYLDFEYEHQKCDCCGETFHVDALEDDACAECRAVLL